MSERPIVVPDVNVLVALTNPAHVLHREAHAWLRGVTKYATTPITESGLLRMLLNPVVTGQRVGSAQAIRLLSDIRADPRAVFLPDDSTLAEATVDTTGLAGYRQVTDWHLLNLAAAHGGVLVTFDRKLVRSVLPADASRVIALG